MSSWKIARPAERYNYARNPQFFRNITDGWEHSQAGTGGSWSWDDGYRWRGIASLKQVAGDQPVFAETETTESVNLAVGATMSVTVRTRGDSGATGEVQLYDVTNATVRASASVTHDGEWHEIKCQWTNDLGAGPDMQVRLVNDTNDSSSAVWWDAVMWEEGGYSTYTDGQDEGSVWLGKHHDSWSHRGASSRTGGELVDLKDDLGFGVDTISGAGFPSVEQHLQSYATRPGGEVVNSKIKALAWSLTGILKDRWDTGKTVHELRRDLIAEFAPWTYARQRQQYQPSRLYYEGATQTRYMDAMYEGGLGGDLSVPNVYQNYDKFTMNLLSPRPWWRSLRDDAADNASPTDFSSWGLIRRERDGSWDDMGMSDSGNPVINVIKYNPVDGRIYVGGDFTDWNGNSSTPGWDYLVAYNPMRAAYLLDPWERVVATDLNGPVHDIAIAATGDVYFCGEFTGVATDGDYIAYYDLSADAYASLAAHSGGTVTSVLCLAFNADESRLYFGGDYTGWNGDGAHDYIGYYKFSDSSWNWLDNPDNDEVDGIVRDVLVNTVDELVYFCGDFTNAFTAGLAEGILAWNPNLASPDWVYISEHSSTGARSLAQDDWGRVYAMHTDKTEKAVARWNGNSWGILGYTDSGSDTLYQLHFGPDGVLYVVGSISGSLGGVENTVGGFYRYVSGAWNVMDAEVLQDFTAIETYLQDPQVPENYVILVGHKTGASGATVTSANTVTVNHSGTGLTYPTFVFRLNVNTSAVVRSIRNVTTGAEIGLEYALSEGEELLVIFAPDGVTFYSSLKGWLTAGRVLTGPGRTGFVLLPGENIISVFLDCLPGSDVETYMYWRPAYAGVD